MYGRVSEISYITGIAVNNIRNHADKELSNIYLRYYVYIMLLYYVKNWTEDGSPLITFT